MKTWMKRSLPLSEPSPWGGFPGAWVRLGRASGNGHDFWKIPISIQHYMTHIQESYNTPLEHTPGNPPSQLWKESLYSLLVKGLGVCSKRCVETTLEHMNYVTPQKTKMTILPNSTQNEWVFPCISLLKKMVGFSIENLVFSRWP